MMGEEEAASSNVKPKSRTRSGGPVLDPDMIFTPFSKFQPVEKLPTIHSVVCMVRHYLGARREGGGVKGVTVTMAIREVAKQVINIISICISIIYK